MSDDIYPQSMLCRFAGFPARIRVICGRAFSETRATPYSFGSRVILSQTPLSGLTQGSLVAGSALPTREIIHSDTGDDTTFDLKVSHYGYGRFYRARDADDTYSLAVIKGLRVEAAGINRSFETVDVWTTLIPAASAITDTPGSTAWPQDAADGAASSITWYQGSAPAGSVSIDGTIQLDGALSIVF